MGRPKKFKLDTSMDADTAKTQKMVADAKQSIFKAQLQEVKVLEAKKVLVDYKSVCSLTTEVFSKLKTLLYAGATSIPPKIIGKDSEEVSQIVYDWVDETLERFAKEFTNKLNNIKIKDDEDDEEIDNESE